jgi:hypothetical protein
MDNTKTIQKKICEGVSQWTNKKCEAKAVGPNTLKKGTREFLDSRFCQMHQPGREFKSKCICPYCPFHNRKRVDKKQMGNDVTELMDHDIHSSEVGFGRRRKKKLV